MKARSFAHATLLLLTLGACIAPGTANDPSFPAPERTATATTDAMAGWAVQPPQALAVYYGWPSAARVTDDYGAPVAQGLARYAIVVLGAGLARPDHPDHAESQALIARAKEAGAEVYGYLDLGISTQPKPPSPNDLAADIAQWKALGATGIFWDDAGFEFAGGLDYPSYRRRVASLVALTHAADMRVFVNVWEPDHLFRAGGADGAAIPPVGLRPDDLVLAESWFVANGRFVDGQAWHRRAEELAAYRRQQPFRLACVATGPVGPGVEASDRYQAAYWAGVMYGCDLFQYTDPRYSAEPVPGGNRLFYYAGPGIAPGDRLAGGVTVEKEKSVRRFVRRTQLGEIVVATDGDQYGYGFYRCCEGGA
jgi:hypothetical protein